MSDEFDPKYDCDSYDAETPEWQASFIVSSWEDRFPDVLTNSMRYLLLHFIRDGFQFGVKDGK